MGIELLELLTKKINAMNYQFSIIVFLLTTIFFNGFQNENSVSKYEVIEAGNNPVELSANRIDSEIIPSYEGADSRGLIKNLMSTDYPLVTIGNQTWMAKNISYDSGGGCYNNQVDNCLTYGRLYTWDEVMVTSGINSPCPPGFHVPTAEEWITLMNNYGGTTQCGPSLKSTELWLNADGNTNSSCFSILPAGTMSEDGTFNLLNEGTAFWTATESAFTLSAHVIVFQDESNGIVLNSDNYPISMDKDVSASCRCIQD